MAINNVYLVYDSSKSVEECVCGVFSNMEDAIDHVHVVARDGSSNKRRIWVEKTPVEGN
jgi:hypothetical protein